MPKILQFRRGTTGELEAITGAPGELFVDTTKDVVVVSDGVTAGGFPLQSELVSGTNIKTINGQSVLGSGDIEIAGGDYSNANVAAYLPTYTGNLVSLTGNVITTANISGAYFIGNGSQLTGLPESYGNANVAAYLPTYTGNLVSLTGLTSTGVVDLTSASNVSLGPVGNVKITGGSSGQVLTTDGTGNISWQTGGSGSPGGTNTQLQFNNNGTFGGITGVTSDGVKITAAVANISITGGTNGQVLTTNGSGSLSWADGGGNVDLSDIAEDVLPMFSEVYDIGSTDKRWYDGYFSNKVDINGAEIRGSEEGVVINSALLVDQLLVSDNMITPDDSSRRQYFGDKGVVVINGNMDIDGDWLGAPVVETLPEILGHFTGELDEEFNTSFSGPRINAIALQPDGKILVGGEFYTYNDITTLRIARLNNDGSLDTSFDTGSGLSAACEAIALQADGKILISGNFFFYNDTAVNRIARLNSDGSLDTSFNFSVSLADGIKTLAVQPDGKILIGSSLNIYRLNSDGSVDNTTFTSPSLSFSNSSFIQTIALQADGKILVGGGLEGGIVRLNSNGSIDTGFDINNGFNISQSFTYLVKKITVQPDGKILVGGNFTFFNTDSTVNIARLNSDGSLDTGFGIDITLNNRVDELTVQPDSKILVGGDFSNALGYFVRLNSDGSVDNSFAIDTAFNDTVFAIVVQPDDKILVGGEFSTYDNTTQFRITRFFSDTVDTIPASFPPNSGEEGFIRYNKDISAFQGFNGTSWELLERVTTPPTSLGTTGTIDIDFTGPMLSTQGALTGDITYAGSSYLAGSSVTIRVVNGSTQKNIAFPSEWVFVGTKPTTIAADKTAILTVTSFGNTEADCVAAWAVEA
jgi:uncharacterized delta-60 repeat protein